MSLIPGLRSTAYQRLHGLSLTRRLVTVVVLLVLVAYLLTTSVSMMMMRSYLVDRADADLRAYIEPLAQRAANQIIEGASGRRYELEQQVFIPPNPYYVLFTPADTTKPAQELMFEQLDVSPPALDAVHVDDPQLGRPYTVRGTDGIGTWRVLAARITDGQGTIGGTIAVALPLTTVDNTVRQLAVFTLGIGLTTLAVVWVLGWFAVRRAFRPLTRIEDTAAAIAAGDLTRRIPPRDSNDEVGSLSDSLNRMLAQIEHSFAVQQASEERMRDFVADASHELRTPLATVKGYAELYRVGAVPPEEVEGAMRRIESEATRMTRLVEDLLTLTRLEGRPRLQTTRVDVTVLAGDVVQDAQVRAPDRKVTLVPVEGFVPGSTAVVAGEDGALRQVLTNLVANALAHTPEGTPVEVALGHVGGSVVVEVRDHGPGLDPETAERVFERFYRADRSRSRESGGTGLGLAIVAAIVGRHGGSVRHLPTPGGGATFRVELPAAEARPALDPV
ncbi:MULTISPECIES: ATP-binding protein [unclassified Ornithinimicrobium]|uniref:sensor histidine kinase n=1 Tax=unclassified Ornithinimicrobium TaxID=2615080 RepID=UPI0038523A35